MSRPKTMEPKPMSPAMKRAATAMCRTLSPAFDRAHPEWQGKELRRMAIILTAGMQALEQPSGEMIAAGANCIRIARLAGETPPATAQRVFREMLLHAQIGARE